MNGTVSRLRDTDEGLQYAGGTMNMMENDPPPDLARHVELYNSLRLKVQALYRRDQYEIHEKVLEFHDYLKRKYPDARDHRLFHLISGSTLKNFYGGLDFPKPDSVEDFINSEYDKAFPNGEGPRKY